LHIARKEAMTDKDCVMLGDLNATGVAKYGDFGLIEGYI